MKLQFAYDNSAIHQVQTSADRRLQQASTWLTKTLPEEINSRGAGATSALSRGFYAVDYAAAKVLGAFGNNIVGLARTFTNDSVRGGLYEAAAHPDAAIRHGWRAWSNLSNEDRLAQGGSALLMLLGASPAEGLTVTEGAGMMAARLDRASASLGSKFAEARGFLPLRSSTSEFGLSPARQIGAFDVVGDGVRFRPLGERGLSGVVAPEVGGEFIGPRIGKSGFTTPDELASEVLSRYQKYSDLAYDRALRADAAGRLKVRPGVSQATRVGQYTDRIAQSMLKGWLKSEGIPNSPNGLVRINRWLRDPAGTGLYRIPDVRVPSANMIFDGTIGYKWSSTPQVVDFMNFSAGDQVVIVRPGQLGGSYSIIP
jgi:hypothetical protein